jgi:chemotaxis family two-component system sensor kinase Cph1
MGAYLSHVSRVLVPMKPIDDVTLDNCESEPIHIPGAIQPHGVLLACRGEQRTVVQVSANVERLLGRTPQEVLGTSLGTLFEADSGARIEALASSDLRQVSAIRVTTAGGVGLDAAVHQSGDCLVVELEQAAADGMFGVGSFDPRLRAALLRLQGAADVESLCEAAAEEARRLTGFDRVMVYRFDANWNGEVVAERKRDELEPFLGLHYPASDIPAQARRLYTVNWLRFIADVGYRPVPLLDADAFVGGAQAEPRAACPPLNLSHSMLRSVSPVHIEYLKNMGVTASMSISLVIEGKLAGLIACHHYSGPYVIPFAVRDTVEYLGRALSWQLHLMQTADLAKRRGSAQEAEAEMIRSVATSEELIDGLDVPALLDLTCATSAAVVLAEGVRRMGPAPSRSSIEAIAGWLVEAGHDVYATDHLASDFPDAAPWDENAAGLLAVAISRELREYILWFRPAVERTIRWAGDPRKSVTWSSGDRAPRLTPRGSFELWLETVRGRAIGWEKWQVGMASSLRRVMLGGVRRRAVELRSVNDRLVAADRAKDEFIATVSHELRTPLNAISGWTALLQTSDAKPDRVQRGLEVISRNARLQTRLIEDLLDMARITSGKLSLELEPVDFTGLVESVVEGALVTADAKGISVRRVLDSSAELILGDPARLRQIVSNLLSNAIKFSPKGGAVKVLLQRVESDVELVVSDNGQGIDPQFLAQLFEPFRQQDQRMNRRSQGIGLGLAIVKRLTELHGGKVSAESAGIGRGSAFHVRLPMAPLRARDSAPAHESAATPQVSLEGVKILLIEDETDARELLRHVLERAKASVTEAPDATAALAILFGASLDVIVSDIGLPDVDGLEFMRRLRKLPPEHGGKTPAVALTAYTRATDRTAALRAGFQAHVSKPLDADELLAVVASLCDRLGQRE